MAHRHRVRPPRPVVVLDADVLVPPGLRDLLLSCADAGVFRPVWQEEIEREVARNAPAVAQVSRGTPLPQAVAQVGRVLAAMNDAFPDARRPLTEWTSHVMTMTNHVKDRHVLAAAVGAGATHVITCNLADFPVASHPKGVVVLAPSDFLLGSLGVNQAAVLAAVEAMAARHRHPPHTVMELAEHISGGVHTGPFGGALMALLRTSPTGHGPQ